jgi:RNA-splicing ligase RtcB
MKSVTIDPELLEEMNVNYSYQTQADFVPSVPESEINTHEDVNTDEVREDLIPDEKPAEDADIDSIEEIPTNEAEEDQIVLVPEPVVSESELNKPENDSDTVSNNNQIEETNGGDDFEWF